MSAGVSYEPTFEPGVREFLKEHHREEAFQQACDLVRACFPELQGMKVRLLEDPDEEGHTWVVLHVMMPATHPLDLLLEQERRYYHEEARRFPPPGDRPCALSIDFSGD